MHHEDRQLGKLLAADARKILGENVKRLREWYKDNKPEDARATQKGLESLSGIHQTTVGRIEKGENATELDSLVALANAFRVEPWHLLCPDLQPDDLYLPVRKSVYERIKTAIRGIDLP